MPLHYPFSAVLGCEPEALDDMGLALVLTTIAPEIGGVLIRGEKGTAKSTTVRALAAVLPPIEVYAADRFSVDPADTSAPAGASSPDGPFTGRDEVVTRPVRLVELPVGATEDRVLGSVHLERALSQGTVEYEPGLLARAHRGVLYVDEVNLLHDHLVDLLLDAAAMGRVSVERDGVSLEHAARFVLVGTMNPEEGELRPQLLDRFGLAVEVAAPRDAASRVEVVRRRMAFDAEPAEFVARYRSSDSLLTSRIEEARSRTGKVRLGDAALLKIAEICSAFEVDGLRADIVTARAAVAHAAWSGRDEVTRADIRRAALLALPHRRRRNPFDAPGLDEELLDRLLGDGELPPDPPEDPGSGEQSTDRGQEMVDQSPPGGPGGGGGEQSTVRSQQMVDQSPPGGSGGGGGEQSTDRSRQTVDQSPPGGPGGGGGEQSTDRSRQTVDQSPLAGERRTTVGAATPYRPRLLKVDGIGDGEAGRRSRAIASTGRRVGARPPDGPTGSLHLVETLLAAAGKQGARGRTGGRVELRREDLRVAVREGREANLVLFCVDASGSMAARKRMTQVKTAILSLLLDAYRRRDKVGLVTFRGHEAELALPPTRSVDIAAVRLDGLPAGGRTPLAEGLLEAARVLTRERLRDRRLRPLLVVVTDGRATGGTNAVQRSLQAADHVAGLGITTVVLDGESGPLRLGLAVRLAERLRAEHVPVGELSAEALTDTVRTRGAA